MSEVKAMSRAGRINQIKMALLLHEQRTNANELTAYDIARKIGMRAEGPRFREILSGMVRDKQIRLRTVKNGPENKVTAFKAWYSLFDQDKPNKREIKVKKAGRNVDQLELF